ncbi:C-terminal binding protein [Halomicrococcus sp. NG-SE-24]|uniref:C-terminal binding protein n=1 Tax=Halomicrococcus sp. NG-SE-24 TaxID=3436928 RepID=UPI003D959C80
MPTVLITDSDFPDSNIERDVLNGTNTELKTAQASTAEEVIEAAESVEADALLVQYAPITKTVFERLDGLQAVGRYGIGVDNVDLDAANDHGVQVVNVPSYCEDEVSTHTFALLLACVRKVSSLDAAVKDGTWDWTGGRPIHCMRGRTLGLAGFGKIPQHLVQKVNGFGVDVIAYDPYVSEEKLDGQGIEKVSFDALLDRSDYISVHTPLTEETEEMFDADAFDQMKDTAVLVNTSRGSVIDTDALAEAIKDGQIAGAGLDVLPNEPPENESLSKQDEVVVTPHIAWYSEESFDTLRRTVTSDIERLLNGGAPENLVNDV